MKRVSLCLLLLTGLLTGCGRSPNRLAKRGLAALDAGRPDLAADLLGRAVQGRVDDAELGPLWGALGLAEARAGRLDAAVSAFQTASDLKEDDFWIHLNFGALLVQLERHADAVEPLTTAVRADTERTEALELLALASVHLGELGLAQSMLEEAVLRVNAPRVLTSLAVLAPNEVESRRRLEEALRLDPAFAPAALNLAILFDRGGTEPSMALHYYERFLAVTPGEEVDPQIRDRVETLKRRRDGSGEQEEAVRQIRDILAGSREAAREGNPVLALNLATRASQLARRLGRDDLEERALRQGVDAAPGQGRSHAALGQFYLERGRNAEAQSSFREAARLAPEALPAQIGLARAAVATQNQALARSALERAEALASSGGDLDVIAALYLEGVRDRRAARRVERLRAERFPD